jgi:hypothetical protein
VFQLSKYPALNNFEKQTSVPKVYMILGLAGLYFFLIFFNIAGEFLVNIAGFIIPGYYSLEALFSASKVDDTQWLTVRIPHFLIAGSKSGQMMAMPNCVIGLTRYDSTGLPLPS